MPKAPTPPPPVDIKQVTQQDMATRLQGAQEGQALSTIGQSNPFGTLDYTTSIDPITGLPKYQANMKYSPEQQQIFDYLQSTQTGMGAKGLETLGNNFGRYNSIDLIGCADSLTKQAMDPTMANMERFMAPERDQLRTQLINQGLVEGSPAYQQQMDKLTNQQGLTKGQWLASYTPQAFQMAQGNL